jgi:hypothetical protein
VRGLLRAIALAGFMAVSHGLSCGTALAGEPSPFDKLAGRWVGEGRFGTRDGNTEAVKCRVTYILSGASHDDLKQTIRCAAASGSIEVQSLVSHAAGKLSGTWKELSRDMSGELSGEVTPKGFRVVVKGASLNANMTIILVSDVKQVVEIQFIDSALIGLTLVLEKG